MFDWRGALRLTYRLPWLAFHVLIATPLVVIMQSAPGRALSVGGRSLSDISLTSWAAATCRIFGVGRRVKGEFGSGPELVAANHISWLDIQLLHSVAHMGFVGKAEISEWPVVGWLARVGGTVFHQRGSHDSASGVVAAMSERLRAGSKVAIFPEGGILPGEGVKYFHARLFAAAIDSGALVRPVMIRYLRDGSAYHDITFRPGEHFMANFFRLLMQRRCNAELRIMPPIDPRGKQRRQLAGEAQADVSAAFDEDVPGA
jgi:1-acyl-sn-glycerol-3-phosphate acyltransferase